MSRIHVVNPFPTSSDIDMKTLLFADSAASSRRLRLLPLTAACAAASLSIAASAETLRVEAPVVVTATRTEKPLAEAAGSISVVTSEAIEERAPSTFGEALLGIPNVSVSDFQDPKFTRISIRGSDANQITYVIDGVRQDNYAYSGNHPIGIFIEPDLLKQVEVRRGGGSALYGNGGIGGILAVTTKNASDFLEGNESFGVTAKSGYSSIDRSWSRSGYLYGRWDIYDMLIAVTRRDSGEVKTSRGYRNADETDVGYTSVMAKLSAIPSDSALLSIAYNFDDYDSFWLTEGDPVNYDYRQHRLTTSFEYADDGFFDLKSTLQYTKAEYEMNQYLSTMRGDQGNSDDFESWNGSVQNTNRFALAGSHALTYGFDFSLTKQDSLTYNPFSGGEVPDGSRPDAKGTDFGIFVQDEYALNEFVSVIPALRYSYFKREAVGDEDLPSLSDSKVTPSLTVSFAPTPGLGFWASAAAGFRPPILDEIYYSQDIIPGLTDSVVEANPDLKPEKSWNYEVGMNANFADLAAEGDALSMKTALFYDDVKDFINIESWDDAMMTTHYRAENIGHVVRKGVEVSGTYRVGSFEGTAAYGWIDAENRETGKRVSGIAPQTASLRLGYKVAPAYLTLWYRLNWYDVSSADRERNASNGTNVDYKSFALHGIGLTWAPRIPNFWDFTAGIAVENLTNEKFRYVNGTYGYARGVRAWVSGRF